MPTREDIRNNRGGNQPQPFQLSDKEFERIRTLVKAKTGISLGLHKRDLVISRLSRRLRALELQTFSQYLDYLDQNGEEGELVQMINQITTNKTDFYREKHHFDHLSEVLLPQLVREKEAQGDLVLRCWSAGCSSGEEPYTLAITLSEFFRDLPGWDFRILATDLDTTMLEKASRGLYDAQAVAPVPRANLSRYFTREGRGAETFFRVKPSLRQLITFRKFNLMHPTYPLKVALDFIFCRNVLIYFDLEDKRSILTKFHQVLKPGGHIFVGHSESLMMVKDLFQYLATTIYRRVDR